MLQVDIACLVVQAQLIILLISGRARTRELLLNLRGSLGEVDVRHLVRKVEEQEHIVGSQEDAKALQKALAAFTSLQHVQILRVQDWEDGVLLGYIRQNGDHPMAIDLNWAPACSHSTKTLGAALLASSSPCSRFSSPMLSTQSAIGLATRPPRLLVALARRLTSLELHFDDPTDLDSRMLALSNLFKLTFTAAEGMQAVHLGFPSHRPLTLRLDDVFHSIKWEKLTAFGIQAWKLDSEEIIALIRRHRDRLRGLRLRDVHLKEGSYWKDILRVLRDDLHRLDWVSLRRIGYARRFDEQWANTGIEIEDVPGGDSESADEDDAFSRADSDLEMVDERSDTDATETSDEEDDENGPQAHELGLPQILTNPANRCDCNGQDPRTAEELGDDGIWVSNLQRKLWERWCVRRCIHLDPHLVPSPKFCNGDASSSREGP